MEQQLVQLDHFAILAPKKTVEECVAFYKTALGLVPGCRPESSLPGYWLYSGGRALVHLTVSEQRAHGQDNHVHHIALRCVDLSGTLCRLDNAQITYRRNYIAALGITQLVVRDPTGTALELTFPAALE